jgi:hypothetical protein
MCILSLIVSQVLLMSTSPSKFSKAVNLFKILIKYCSVPSVLFSFLKLSLSTSNFFVTHLLTASLSITFATTSYWSVSQFSPLKDQTLCTLECHLLSIKMWSVCLCVLPSGDVQANSWIWQCGNIVLLTDFRMWQSLLLKLLEPIIIINFM